VRAPRRWATAQGPPAPWRLANSVDRASLPAAGPPRRLGSGAAGATTPTEPSGCRATSWPGSPDRWLPGDSQTRWIVRAPHRRWSYCAGRVPFRRGPRSAVPLGRWGPAPPRPWSHRAVGPLGGRGRRATGSLEARRPGGRVGTGPPLELLRRPVPGAATTTGAAGPIGPLGSPRRRTVGPLVGRGRRAAGFLETRQPRGSCGHRTAAGATAPAGVPRRRAAGPGSLEIRRPCGSCVHRTAARAPGAVGPPGATGSLEDSPTSWIVRVSATALPLAHRADRVPRRHRATAPLGRRGRATSSLETRKSRGSCGHRIAAGSLRRPGPFRRGSAPPRPRSHRAVGPPGGRGRWAAGSLETRNPWCRSCGHRTAAEATAPAGSRSAGVPFRWVAGCRAIRWPGSPASWRLANPAGCAGTAPPLGPLRRRSRLAEVPFRWALGRRGHRSAGGDDPRSGEQCYGYSRSGLPWITWRMAG